MKYHVEYIHPSYGTVEPITNKPTSVNNFGNLAVLLRKENIYFCCWVTMNLQWFKHLSGCSINPPNQPNIQ